MRDVNRAMHELRAFDADSRQLAKDIAEKAEGRNANVNGFKGPFADLTLRGLIDSKIGREGGYWLAEHGRELLTAFDDDSVAENPPP